MERGSREPPLGPALRTSPRGPPPAEAGATPSFFFQAEQNRGQAGTGAGEPRGRVQAPGAGVGAPEAAAAQEASEAEEDVFGSAANPQQERTFGSWVPEQPGQQGQQAQQGQYGRTPPGGPQAAPEGEARDEWGTDSLARELEEACQMSDGSGPAAEGSPFAGTGEGGGAGEGEGEEGEDARRASPPLLSIPQRLASAFARGPARLLRSPSSAAPSPAVEAPTPSSLRPQNPPGPLDLSNSAPLDHSNRALPPLPPLPPGNPQLPGSAPAALRSPPARRPSRSVIFARPTRFDPAEQAPGVARPSGGTAIFPKNSSVGPSPASRISRNTSFGSSGASGSPGVALFRRSQGPPAVPFSDPFRRPAFPRQLSGGEGVPASTPVGGQRRVHMPALTESPRPNALQKSVIMCMDPTCNKCPPEMHALRNRKLMEKLQAAREDEEDDDSDDGRGGGARRAADKAPVLSLEEELEEELEAEGFEGFEAGHEGKGDVEQGRRMVIRICGLRIVFKKGGKQGAWLKAGQLLKDLTVSLCFNPNNPYIHKWNMVFVFAAMLGFIFDPLFFFVFTAIYSPGEVLCLAMSWNLAIVVTVIMSFVQLWYLLHMLITVSTTLPCGQYCDQPPGGPFWGMTIPLPSDAFFLMGCLPLYRSGEKQFRTAYVVPAPRESWSEPGRMIVDPSGKAPGELVFDARLIARHYIRSGGFFLDLLCIIPLPQVLVMAVIPSVMSNYSACLICLVILLQVIPRAIRLSLKFMSTSGGNGNGLLESAWATFSLNLLLYLIAAHLVGSTWYLFSVQRVGFCLSSLCSSSPGCTDSLLYCPQGPATSFGTPAAQTWASDASYNACLVNTSGGGYGIFATGMALVANSSFFTRYLASLYWGFQQLSTIAGNQVPAPWIPEIIFILIVSCLGLLLLALLIGNMSNFLQALSRKSFEYQMNRRDVQLWMYRRNIPNKLQRKVRELLRLQWATTRGVEDNEVMPLLTEDLQRDLRRRLCVDLLKVSPLFYAMNPQVLDAFCARLKQRIYIDGTVIVKEGYPVNRLFFVLKGEVIRTSNRTGYIDKDSMASGDIVGEEVLVQYMDQYGSKKSFQQGTSLRPPPAQARDLRRSQSRRDGFSFEALDVLPSSRFTALCVGPVEGYSLEARDVELVCRQYSQFLQDDKVQLALNRCSRARKVHYARTIQLAYRRHLRQKYQMSMKECVEATMERRFGKLISKKKSGSDVSKLLEDELGSSQQEDSQESGGSKQVTFGALPT